MLHGELWRKPWNIWTLYLWTSQSYSFHSLWMPAISTWIGDCSSLLLRLSMLDNFWCVLSAHLNLTFNHLRWIWCDLLLSIQVTLWLYTLLHQKKMKLFILAALFIITLLSYSASFVETTSIPASSCRQSDSVRLQLSCWHDLLLQTTHPGFPNDNTLESRKRRE